MKTLSNVLDFDKFTYIENAPLKTISENSIRDMNTAMLQNSNIGFHSLTPHFYNKPAFVYLKEAEAVQYYSGTFLRYGEPLNDSSTRFRNLPNCLGDSKDIEYPVKYFQPIDPQDYVIYYQLIKASQVNWGTPNQGYYDNVEMVCTSFYEPFVNPAVFPHEKMGMKRYCVVNSNPTYPTPVPQPTHDFDDWFVVSAWQVYSRPNGSSSDRVGMGKGTFFDNVYPAFFWDINGIYYYWVRGTWYRSTPKYYNGMGQGITFCGLITNTSANNLWNLSDWRVCNTQVDTEAANQIFANSQIKHKSTLGNDIKLLIPNLGELKEWFFYGNALSGEPFESFRYTDGNSALLAFRNEAAFLNFMADWGINTRITNNIELAKNQPAELFPNYIPSGGFVPDGGNESGYDGNKSIASIPSFSDNTSDKIDVITPNISSINAASAYALDLSSVKLLFNWLMTDNFINNISNLFNDKLSALDDLKILPFDLVNHDSAHTSQSANLTIANVSGEIPCYKILPAYNCIVNGGKYRYSAYWGNYNDYTASSYYLYIPYGGIVELSPSHVVNSEIEIKYAVDIMTGAATAIIYSNGVFIKTTPCQMGQTVPITFTNTNQRQIKNALTAINTANSIMNTVKSAALTAATGGAGAMIGAEIGGGALGIGSSIAQNVLTNPLTVGSVGNFSANTALVMPQSAFLIISRVQLSIPSSSENIIGKPSNIKSTIRTFVGSGFVQINVGHVNTSATADEQKEILSLLRNGIFI